jgi:hypothetical protein
MDCIGKGGKSNCLMKKARKHKPKGVVGWGGRGEGELG